MPADVNEIRYGPTSRLVLLTVVDGFAMVRDPDTASRPFLLKLDEWLALPDKLPAAPRILRDV